MTSVDINKWISGEIEAFFDPPTVPAPVAADSNPGEEQSTARPAIRKFSYSAIAAVVVVALALVVLASIVVAMRYPTGPSPAAGAKPQPSESKTTSEAAKDAVSSTPVEPTAPVKPITPAAPTPTEIVSTAAPLDPNQPATHPGPQHAAFLGDVGTWYDQRSKAAPIPQRKPSPVQRTSSRHQPRYSSRVEGDSGEATRLMVDELRQRGIAVGPGLDSLDPK